MTDEPFDITSYVKSFEIISKTGLQKPEPVEGDPKTFEWNFPVQETSIDLVVDPNFHAELMKAEQGAVMKMQQRGKYWFDVQYDADVIMTDVHINPEDGSIDATYKSLNIQDLTNRGWLARFLRWLFRRAKS